MKLRFQADNDLDQPIVATTRRPNQAIDFQTAPALGLHHMPVPGVVESAVVRAGLESLVAGSRDFELAGSLASTRVAKLARTMRESDIEVLLFELSAEAEAFN